MSSTSSAKVYVASADGYDDESLHGAVARGLAHVGRCIEGNVLALPDWGVADPGLAPAGTTRPELVHAAMDIMLQRDPKLYVVFSGHSTLAGPTRRIVAEAAAGASPLRRRGYFSLTRRHRRRIVLRPMDETRNYRYQLSVSSAGEEQEGGGRHFETLTAGWELYHADSVLLFPRLRWDRIRHTLFGAIQLQGQSLLRDKDRARVWGGKEGCRAAEFLELTDPDLIITDGVDIGFGGSPITQGAFRLGLVVVANNAVAHDAVCARLLGQDPRQDPAIRRAHDLGFGPLDPQDIDLKVEGDSDELRRRVRGFGEGRPLNPEEFWDFFGRSTGHRLPLELRSGVPPDRGAERVALEFLWSCWDLPGHRERMKRWPALSLLLGPTSSDPKHGRVVLVGDAAIASLQGRAELRWVGTLWRSRLGGSPKVFRYRLRGGRRGWGVAFPGDPPALSTVAAGLGVCTLGRVRWPLSSLFVQFEDALYGVVARLRSRWVNRKGIRWVHARKIERFLNRPWRLAWAEPAALAESTALPALVSPPEQQTDSMRETEVSDDMG